ncbi:LPXTG cell wall anchor domain-containing protein [Streptococcus suis]|nr:LPXTG cell wall anchor domain-containing protein [Streptococcus suis]HEL2576460.1 LPXTG cell wall anchor domain-containing protein [Streptococcus suis]
MPETTVTLTVSHLVGGAAAGGSAEVTSILSQGTGNTEQSASNQSSGQTAITLPNTGQEDALTSLGLVVGMFGFGFVKRKKLNMTKIYIHYDGKLTLCQLLIFYGNRYRTLRIR